MRYAEQVTAFPAGITTGSTWDTALMYARGNALGMSKYSKSKSRILILGLNTGTESKALGVHVQLGPVGGPLGKIPEVGWSVQLAVRKLNMIGRTKLGRILE